MALTGLASIIDAVTSTTSGTSEALTEESLFRQINEQYQTTQAQIEQREPQRREILNNYTDLYEQRLNDFQQQVMPPLRYLGVDVGSESEEKKKPAEEKKELTLEFLLKIQEKKEKNLESKNKSEIENIKNTIKSKEDLIKNTETALEEKKIELENLEKKSVKLDIPSQIEAIKLNPKIQLIYVLGKDIVFETEMLFVQDFYMDHSALMKRKTKKAHELGRFAIRIDNELNQISVTNLTYKYQSYDLPTIKDGHCCWGNIYNDIVKDLSEYNLIEFINDMIGYIEAPSNQSAYIRWDAFFKNREKTNRKPYTVRQGVGSNSNPNIYWTTGEMTITSASTLAHEWATFTPSYFEPITYPQRENTYYRQITSGRYRNIERLFGIVGIQRFLGTLTEDGKEFLSNWLISISNYFEGSITRGVSIRVNSRYAEFRIDGDIIIIPRNMIREREVATIERYVEEIQRYVEYHDITTRAYMTGISI